MSCFINLECGLGWRMLPCTDNLVFKSNVEQNLASVHKRDCSQHPRTTKQVKLKTQVSQKLELLLAPV